MDVLREAAVVLNIVCSLTNAHMPSSLVLRRPYGGGLLILGWLSLAIL